MVGEKRPETAGRVVETRSVLVERAHSAGGVGITRRIVKERINSAGGIFIVRSIRVKRIDSHLWADTFDRKLTDFFSVESEVAKAIADQLRVKLTGREEQEITAKPTDNPEAYDAYLRGLAYSLKAQHSPANSLGGQKHLREAVRLDPKFALAWALLSYVDSVGYIGVTFKPRNRSGKRRGKPPRPPLLASPISARD